MLKATTHDFQCVGLGHSRIYIWGLTSSLSPEERAHTTIFSVERVRCPVTQDRNQLLEHLGNQLLHLL